MKKNRFSMGILATTLSLAMLGSMVGCSGGKTGSTEATDTGKEAVKGETESDAAPTAEPVEFDIFQFKVEVAQSLQEAIDLYMSENPHVKINLQTVGGGDDYGAALKAKFQSGQEPTIFNVGGPQDVKDWTDKLENLSDQPWVSMTLDGLLGGVTVDQGIYGMPFAVEGYGYIYNKGIFEAAGIDVATIKDYASLDAALGKLDEQIKAGTLKEKYPLLEAVFEIPTKEKWVTGLHGSNVVLNHEFDSSLSAFAADKVDFKYADAYQKLIDLQVKYSSNAATPAKLNAVDYSMQVEQGLAIERVAVVQQGNWIYSGVSGIDPAVAENLGILPIPVEGGKGDTIPVGVPMYWAVNNSSTENQRVAAKDFLNWLYTSDAGKDFVANKFFFIPPFSGYENYPAKDALGREVMRYMTEGKTTPWVFMGYPTAWGEDGVGVNIQRYVAGEMTWDEAIEDAKAKWTTMR